MSARLEAAREVLMAILGAIIFAVVASSMALRLPIVALDLGAVGGALVPTLLALLGKLFVILIRLTVAVLKVAVVLALFGGIVYAIVRLITG